MKNYESSIYSFSIIDSGSSSIEEVCADAAGIFSDDLWLACYGHFKNPYIRVVTVEAAAGGTYYGFEVYADV
jgi:hypothetical protein